MSLNFITRFFTGNKRSGSSGADKETAAEPHPVPLRRVSSSKSGKLKIRKVKSSQNIKDIHFYAKPEDATDESAKEKVNNEQQEENYNVDDVIREMYEVVQSGRVK